MVELVKNYVALSQSELRKALGVTRLSKVAVANVPTLEAKKEDGSQEELFMFRNESKPYREVNVKMVSALEWDQHLLCPEKQTWELQGQEVWRHTANTLQNDSKVHALLVKDAVLTLEEFLAKKSTKKAEEQGVGDDEQGGTKDMEMHGDEDDEDDEEKLSSLVGAAADVLQMSTQPLRRSASSLSLSTSKKSQESQGAFQTPDSSSKQTSKSRSSQDNVFENDQMDKQTCITAISGSKKSKGSIERGKCLPTLGQFKMISYPNAMRILHASAHTG